MTTYNNEACPTTEFTTNPAGYGIMGDNIEHYGNCEHYYGDGSVVVLDETKTTTTYYIESSE